MRGFVLGSIVVALVLSLSSAPALVSTAREEPAATAADPTPEASISPAEADAVFERFKSLAGRWRARSSAGWEDTVTYEVVARGSVVAARTAFADAPERTMYTMIYRDGGRLLLTHFCEARNQPRLWATSVEDDGAVTFTFLDATNLPTRDHGHMDQAIYRFGDGDSFSSRWTWYEDGKEGWLEEIAYTRIPDAGMQGSGTR